MLLWQIIAHAYRKHAALTYLRCMLRRHHNVIFLLFCGGTIPLIIVFVCGVGFPQHVSPSSGDQMGSEMEAGETYTVRHESDAIFMSVIAPWINSCSIVYPFELSGPDICCPIFLNTGFGGLDIFEVKLIFEMLTVCGQQHSFSTHELMFFFRPKGDPNP